MSLLCCSYILSFAAFTALGTGLPNQLSYKAKQKTGGLDMLCEACFSCWLFCCAADLEVKIRRFAPFLRDMFGFRK